MARFLVMSDVHIEFGDMLLPKPEELGQIDAVLLAGDVMPWTNCAHWADKLAQRYGVPVVLIAGNHEFYARVHPDRTIDVTLAAIRSVAAKTEGRVVFLENDAVTIAGVRILGATLWTDFCLFGVDDQAGAMMLAQVHMNDFLICWQERGKPFSPRDALARHEASRRWLRERLQEPGLLPTVVMTHHLPCWASMAARFRDDPLSAAYASRLDDLVERSGAALWVHGHTHDSADTTLGKTRVLCNPRGYLGHALNKSFDPRLIVEVNGTPRDTPR